ncbi:hypothetical protein OSB04_008282 [Centaurea solstitialis]|uniref:Protein FAR1-RELATED SEQUENCE n=1 Tax=Centaurea solstitialis TaxID=347529 RepID=A0AA38WJB9_9ASTR|nr:hypothetical protein OSB04_008282 [Centaurea solstitialis]
MQRRSPNFFYVIDMDDEGRLQNVLGADKRSRAAYESFGDVISFDSTYLTNKYSMSFAPFVGVNHHGQSILFRCGLLSREDTDTYHEFLFDGYVNSKTSLQQFVEQYDNALKSKIEKETMADFESLNSSYKLITEFHFERQFHKAYTNAIFKLFQDELRGMVFCNCLLVKTDGARHVFHVTDIVEGKHGDFKKRVVYTVSYDKVQCDIRCSCHLFEFRGIFCRHMVKILIEKDVKEIKSRFIFSRWRKDVKHRHYLVINCYEDMMSGDEAKQFDHLCSKFYEVAQFANSREKYEYLMSCKKMAKEKLNDDSIWECSSNINLIPEDSHHASVSTTKLLPRLQVRSIGRPPSKRKEKNRKGYEEKKEEKCNISST